MATPEQLKHVLKVTAPKVVLSLSYLEHLIPTVENVAVISMDDILAQPFDNKNKFQKPALVQLAYQAYVDFGAEAIICISNKKVTWDLVCQFESRGIPAFGVIWDS